MFRKIWRFMIVCIKIVGKVRSFEHCMIQYLTKLRSYDCNAWIKNFTEITSLIPKDMQYEILAAFGYVRGVPSRPKKRFQRVETGLSKYTSPAWSFPIICNEIYLGIACLCRTITEISLGEMTKKDNCFSLILRCYVLQLIFRSCSL